MASKDDFYLGYHPRPEDIFLVRFSQVTEDRPATRRGSFATCDGPPNYTY